MQPVPMPPNVLDHNYVGGELLADFRRVPLPSPQRPEEWLAATVHRTGLPGVGLSTTDEGTTLAELVAADREGWTGSADPAPGAAASDTGLLTKLLDAGQRLPVHVHPTRPFARRHLGSCYGKSEAWHILEVRGDDPAVWVGFGQSIDPHELAVRVETQDSAWMLEHMNKFHVEPGDGVFVQAGQPHAIGAGVFLLEVQEPSDFSIILEWSATTADREQSHLDLGFETALQAVRHRATSGDELVTLRHHVPPALHDHRLVRALPAAADPFFRMDIASPIGDAPVSVGKGFAVVIVTDGAGHLGWAGGDRAITRGEVLAVPNGVGDWSVSGPVRAMICRPAETWPSVPLNDFHF